MNLLGMLAKFWSPGAVKTRLARSIGAVDASRLYYQFLDHLLHRLADRGDRRILAFTPAAQRPRFAQVAPAAWELACQAEGDLGQRMEAFFSTHVRSAGDRVVLIGTDSPTLPCPVIDEAFAALREAPVVLGPTPDGGYYLVGASGRVPPIFADIDWSTPAVWRQTTQRLHQAGVRFRELTEWYDVDEFSDLIRLRDELGQLAQDDLLWRDLSRDVRNLLAKNE